MDEDLFIHFPFNLYSASAVSAARRYVTLIEAQLSQAYTDERAGALEHYHSLPNRDEGDYEAYVRAVERDYEDEFRPILRFTSVVYLYIVFETHVSRHVSEIQRILQGDPAILKDLKAKNRCGIVEAAKIYFRDHANLTFFADEQWLQLNEIACVRHCIVHDAGIPRDSKHRDTIYALETRKGPRASRRTSDRSLPRQGRRWHHDPRTAISRVLSQRARAFLPHTRNSR